MQQPGARSAKQIRIKRSGAENAEVAEKNFFYSALLIVEFVAKFGTLSQKFSNHKSEIPNKFQLAIFKHKTGRAVLWVG